MRKWISLVLVVLIGSILMDTYIGGLETVPGEFIQLGWATRIAEGQSLYSISNGFIEGVTPAYPPVYYLVTGFLVSIFGSDILVGKLVSLVAYSLTCLVVFLITRKVSNSVLMGLFSVVVFQAHALYRDYAMNFQVDCLGVLFTVVGVYLVISRKFLWSIPVIVLALFTKQYFISVPIAVGIYFIVTRQWSVLLEWSIGVVSLGLGAFVIVNFLTDGELFKHVILYPIQSGEIKYTVPYLLVAVIFISIPLLASVYYIFKYRDFGLVTIYLFVSFIVMAVTIGKEGGAPNYSFELVFTTAIFTGLLLKRILDSKKTLVVKEV